MARTAEVQLPPVLPGSERGPFDNITLKGVCQEVKFLPLITACRDANQLANACFGNLNDLRSGKVLAQSDESGQFERVVEIIETAIWRYAAGGRSKSLRKSAVDYATGQLTSCELHLAYPYALGEVWLRKLLSEGQWRKLLQS